MEGDGLQMILSISPLDLNGEHTLSALPVRIKWSTAGLNETARISLWCASIFMTGSVEARVSQLYKSHQRNLHMRRMMLTLEAFYRLQRLRKCNPAWHASPHPGTVQH